MNNTTARIIYRWYRCGDCILCYTPVACPVVTIFTLGAFSAINHACCAAAGLCRNNNNNNNNNNKNNNKLNRRRIRRLNSVNKRCDGILIIGWLWGPKITRKTQRSGIHHNIVRIYCYWHAQVRIIILDVRPKRAVVKKQNRGKEIRANNEPICRDLYIIYYAYIFYMK